uniref:Acetyl-CoA carboxylase 1-like n=1 Tax=Crassostrea virginica TaxID=6565 RepID=A0A8B8A9S7_CRAVI|nr:acetyl-CoA carboxylase 1-like [Crassostrea virginica]
MYGDGGRHQPPRCSASSTQCLTFTEHIIIYIHIAMGLPLYRLKDIRQLYYVDTWGDSPSDFSNPFIHPCSREHVKAAGITSGNTDGGFKPSSGTVQELNFGSSKNVWGYFSVSATGGLQEYADSQFGHCFSWGEDREDA